ncbi:hypothetical protein CB0940_11107 [Cercospora beticola]|uniref:Uncharacterized protein n=1 Tax=Cercospora beticola TaxID=122368 RepID=A0A2G5HEE9_CERBT|nr:hypothetical protein CB0940_11107 [Cercospora beticola]PIA90643.1 hypothetical protein CB0940_11107 [Cercospora beticola]WPB07937.1 hypothetical protein RHO25_012601 [Cercospora beticola]
MFATRNQDENAINAQQQVAAAKPLNQSVRGLAPKTPANKPTFKTPARDNKHDENSKLDFGKAGGKPGKADLNAFVTPANNRPRAPLGNKTTNAKALQTPALQVPSEDKPKATSPRLRRSKIKVHESLDTAHDVLNTDPEEREIEYMPPRGVPLNDDPDDILPHPMNLDLLKGENLTRGWWAQYSQRDIDDEFSDLEEKIEKAEAQRKKEEVRKAKAASKPSTSRTGTAAAPKAAPSSLRAKTAASALSTKPIARPAPMARARLTGPATSATRKPAPASGNPRFAAAKAASNSTIGYSKGRSVSTSTRPPLSNIHSRPQAPKEPAQPKSTTLDNLLKLSALELSNGHEDDDEPAPIPTNNALDALFGDEDEEEVFQLDPVQDL